MHVPEDARAGFGRGGEALRDVVWGAAFEGLVEGAFEDFAEGAGADAGFGVGGEVGGRGGFGWWWYYYGAFRRGIRGGGGGDGVGHGE